VLPLNELLLLKKRSSERINNWTAKVLRYFNTVKFYMFGIGADFHKRKSLYHYQIAIDYYTPNCGKRYYKMYANNMTFIWINLTFFTLLKDKQPPQGGCLIPVKSAF